MTAADTDHSNRPETAWAAAAPPHDLSAEIAVLAAMIGSDKVAANIGRRLKPGDFYRPTHGTLFAAMTTMAADGIEVNHMSLASWLAESGDLAAVGGVPFIAELIHHDFAGSAGYHADIVRDRATDRAWIEHADRVRQLMTEPMSTAKRSGMIMADIDNIAATRLPTSGRWLAETVGDTVDQIADIGSGNAASDRMVPTGFADLDRLLGGGLTDGQLIIVAGRPGLGKSTIGMDFARNVSVHCGWTSMFVTLEMSDIELTMRALSAETGIPLALLRSGQLRDDEWDRVAHRIPVVVDAPMVIYDDPGMQLAQIRAEARRIKATRDLRLLVVDYVQLMSSPKRSEGRQQEVADLSRGLKLLAKEIECPVIGMSQLNRGPEQRQDKKPSLGDLRESGAIEQDADIVILLHREDAYDKLKRPGEADFIVAKHRNGPTATITVASQLDRARFVDMAL